MAPILKAIQEFQESLKVYPAIPEGTRERFQPPAVSSPSSNR
jgi:hypothetical protein